jgi:hypothetical protein
MNDGKKWPYHMTRRQFLRYYGLASSAITLSPFFVERFARVGHEAAHLARVYKVQNGDCFQNTARLWKMLGSPMRYIHPMDVVVIKGNAQWPNQGYTNTGCIKGVIDQILKIPGFSGEIIIIDNTTTGGSAGAWGFDATPDNRANNWPDHNWNSLAAEYQATGKPVATKQLTQGPWRDVPFPSFSRWDPADGEGWTRRFFAYNGRPTFLSCPVFESPLTAGRMIDLRRGVWENGHYTFRNVRTIFMPTLNNHGWGGEDYAGVTSAIKSFFGATEIPVSQDSLWNGYYHIHSSSYSQNSARSAGELVGRFLNTLYSPFLYVTAAMFSGWHSRTSGDGAMATNTVLACQNPVSLDFISCRDVISPYAAWLDPNQDNNSRAQMLGCQSQGIGTLDPEQIEVLGYDFNHPTATRLDVGRKIREYQAGQATLAEVKDVFGLYLESD